MQKRFQRKNKKVLGVDSQKAIRLFFGGNAWISIIILALICLFLAWDAIKFFPSHHQNLSLYRKSGQEYVNHLIVETGEYSKLISEVNQAYYQEMDARFGAERGMGTTFEALSGFLYDEGEDLIDDWADALDDEEDEAISEAEAAWSEFLEKSLASVQQAQFDTNGHLSVDQWQALLAMMPEWDPVEEEPPAAVLEAKSKLDAGMKEFTEARVRLIAASSELSDLRDRLTNIARETKEEAEAARSAEERKTALLAGAKEAKTAEQRAEFEARAAKVEVIQDFPFEARTEPIRAAHGDHQAAVDKLKVEMAAGVAMLPAEYSSEAAVELIGSVRSRVEPLSQELDEHLAESSEWRFDEPVSWWENISQFLFGKDWVTNSSWHDFYGFLPLFTGSLMISSLALVVAVPFAIGAAIYVNRVASPLEQTLIKPVIELVQAIPSVVLGFFGIAVLGTQLQELSQVEWLSWVPGFPMQERLNVLTAGLLLALMAIPTIFTLCEDALNNVPRSFSEASFALGATKLQTVLKVVLPTAVSGILAAVLLGFGRVIGETMVVLLVAGNKIQLPDFSEGIGIITQPTHTMTGIIAQEMPEVTPGTLPYRALFLVGLVLFIISLSINITAQRVIRYFGKHG